MDKIEFIEIDTCPNCGSKEKSPVCEVDQYGYLVRFARCNKCELAYIENQIKDTDEFYRRGYRELLYKQDEPIKKEEMGQWKRAERVATYLYKNITHIDSCLDIGCSLGVLCDMIRDIYKCDVAGVELDVKYSDYAKENYNLKIYENLDEIDRKFDLITLVHVLEHYNEPHKELAKIRDLLEDDGVLYIQVPDRTYKMAFTYKIPHTMAFSRRSLNNMLERAGFAVLADVMPCETISVLCEKA